MSSLFPKVESLSSISVSDKETALAVLDTLPSDLAQSWHDQVTVKEGHVSGTYYADVAAALSYLDFLKLYTALGYTFAKLDFMDQSCQPFGTGHMQCGYSAGHTCSGQYCH
jgi:hypothetical protein